MAKLIQKKVNTDVGVEFVLSDLLEHVDIYEFFQGLDVDFDYVPNCWPDDFFSQFEIKVGKEVVPADKLKIKFIDSSRTGEV